MTQLVYSLPIIIKIKNSFIPWNVIISKLFIVTPLMIVLKSIYIEKIDIFLTFEGKNKNILIPRNIGAIYYSTF